VGLSDYRSGFACGVQGIRSAGFREQNEQTPSGADREYGDRYSGPEENRLFLECELPSGMSNRSYETAWIPFVRSSGSITYL
jgi:hypothetical protein